MMQGIYNVRRPEVTQRKVCQPTAKSDQRIAAAKVEDYRTIQNMLDIFIFMSFLIVWSTSNHGL